MAEHGMKVWDPVVRLFHWGVVGLVILAWITAEEAEAIHEWAGYGILALVLVRAVWGFVGPRTARFDDFVRPPGETLAYLKGMLIGRPPHYTGHNPLGGWMAVTLMVLLLLSVATGVLGLQADLFEELHEGVTGLMLGLVVLHVAGALIAGLLHGETLVRAMITGRKKIHSSSR